MPACTILGIRDSTCQSDGLAVEGVALRERLEEVQRRVVEQQRRGSAPLQPVPAALVPMLAMAAPFLSLTNKQPVSVMVYAPGPS